MDGWVVVVVVALLVVVAVAVVLAGRGGASRVRLWGPFGTGVEGESRSRKRGGRVRVRNVRAGRDATVVADDVKARDVNAGRDAVLHDRSEEGGHPKP